MVVSKGEKTCSSQMIVLPIDADRTMVLLAHKLAPPHIIETLPDCTLTPLGREPATTHLTTTQWIVTHYYLTKHHVHHRVPPHEQFVKLQQCPKHEDHTANPNSTFEAEEQLFSGQIP